MTRGSPGLSDSQVSEHVSYIADTLAREPTDEDVHRQLRSAIKARHENEVLRDHIENLKNSEKHNHKKPPQKKILKRLVL